ncbi:MAG: hypothetical protein LWY06_12895 [Firmicutes bacterium]|nr:hypothetical protein [Bacillota bacterium]
MKKKNLFMAAFLLSVLVIGSSAAMAISGEAMGNPFGSGEKITKFVAGYFKIPEAELVKIADKCEYPDDTLAVLMVSKLSGKKFSDIAGMRTRGMSWDAVLAKTGTEPSKLFFKVKSGKIPPLFTDAYKQYDKKQKNKSFVIKLKDRDVRYLCGVKFVTEAFGKDPMETMESFDNRITFVKIVYDLVEAGK